MLSFPLNYFKIVLMIEEFDDADEHSRLLNDLDDSIVHGQNF